MNKTYARVVESLGVLHLLLNQLAHMSCWFEVLPMPDGYYEITVKYENSHRLNELIARYMGSAA